MRQAGDDLQAALAHWQQRLRLMDWVIDLRFVHRHEAEREDGMAYVEVLLPKRHARISLIEPDEIDPEGWPSESSERSIVHELLHIHIHPFNPKQDTPAWTAMEQAVHVLAGALVEKAE